MTPSERAFKAWTEVEVDKLSFWWGVFSIQTIAKRLGRTPAGVSEKARKTKLGAFAQDTISMREFVRLSGYEDSRILASAEALGIKLHRIGVGNPKRPKAKRAYGITEEQQEKLLAHFVEHPNTFYPNKPGSGKTTQGVWGIGRKPPACLDCGRSDKPHYSKGLCDGCYQKVLRNKRKMKMTGPIDRFSGTYRFLSNFFPSQITFGGVRYYSVEHGFQAAKTLDPVKRAPLTIAHGTETSWSTSKAKVYGRKLELRPDWEDVKFKVMEQLLREKFTAHPDLGRKLLATDNRELIEGNIWGDRIWGMVKVDDVWTGENHLGKTLMKIREELRA
jgi:ribA/ribD-fused uncharacterized protein